MITLDDVELMATEKKVSIPLTLVPPVRNGSIDVWISRSKAGPPARGALVRQLVVRDSIVPAFTLYSRDLTAEWPKGGKAFVVVSYAGTVVATGALKLVRP